MCIRDRNAFHGSGTLFSRIILQEVRGDGYDIFLGSPSVVYNEDRSEAVSYTHLLCKSVSNEAAA